MLNKFCFCPVCGSRAFSVSSEKSRRCQSCGFELFVNPSAAVAAFIRNRRGELLVAVRGREPALGTLDLPGGFTDQGETAEQAVEREVAEETGLRIAGARYLFSFPNKYAYSGVMIPTMDLFFECSIADDTPPAAADDVSACQWMSLADLRPDRFGLESIRRAVERYIAEEAG